MNEPTGTVDPLLAPRKVFTVSELNREVRALLEGSLPLLWIEGEISNLSRPSSGHLYFSLKDAQAQVRCAMFRMRGLHLRFRPDNGLLVRVRARVSLYEARGDFQAIVEHMEEAGGGALQRAFEALKARLAQEGLFEPARKRPLPTLPRCVGVVTSPTGAAIRDILSVLGRRFPALPVVVYPVAVQGEGAAAQIAAAIDRAGARGDCDVLIVGRGGGSLEDLWAFNEEVVARAIHRSPIPVVSAVGHEVDVTIADFVADRRAPTPSAAAELLSPDRDEWRARLARREQRLGNALRTRLGQMRRQLQGLERRLKHPGRRLQESGQRVDELEQRLLLALRNRLERAHARLATASAHLHRLTPRHRLTAMGERHRALERRLLAAAEHLAADRRHRLAALTRALDAVSPLATVARGYAIVQRERDGAVVRRRAEVQPGERVAARVGDGRLLCRVEAVDGL